MNLEKFIENQISGWITIYTNIKVGDKPYKELISIIMRLIRIVPEKSWVDL